jgi:TRAP-type C4-dicarboxylate transport system permease small subunit
MMSAVLRIEKILYWITATLTVLLMSVMSVSAFYGVGCRYLLNAAPFWTEELARFMMVWMAMCAAAIGFRNHGHVGLEAIIDRCCPRRLRQWVLLVKDLAILVFFGYVIFFGVQFAAQGIPIVSPATGIAMVLPYAGIPVGGIFCFLQVAINILKDLHARAQPTVSQA